MMLDDLFSARFADGGRGPDEYDCFGLFEELCRRRGTPISPETTPTQVQAKDAAIQSAIGRGEWQRLETPEPGCAVVFVVVPPFATHMGMVLDDGLTFIHIRKGSNVSVERLASSRWCQRIAGFYRHV